MSTDKKRIVQGMLAFALLVTSACASHQTPESASLPPAADGQCLAVVDSEAAGLPPAEIAGLELQEELTVAEPEQTITEEIKELAALGDWEEGTAQPATEEPEVEYDFPVAVNRQVEFYLDFFQNKQRATFARWLARSGRYLPLIQQELADAGLPLDLAYLPMIESGFSLTAYSRARAVGPWQFMRATGVHYGLTVNDYVDERRDPAKSTRAAIAYLSKLYDEFGSWHLAVAAYNAGEGRIRRAIRRRGTDNFWQLAQGRLLNLETKRYVPKLIAAIIIAKNPDQYGFGDIDYEPPLAYEKVEVPAWTSLQAVAVAGDSELETLRNLNRQLRRGITPASPSPYTLKVPVGKGELVARNLERVHATLITRYKSHVVEPGETIESICRRYSLNKTTLLKANSLRSTRLRPGQRLRVPHQVTDYRLLAEGEMAARQGAAPVDAANLVLHTIRPGETISQLARRYNVPTHLIASWNGLTDINRITAGQQLALYLQGPESPAAAQAAESKPVRTAKVITPSDHKRAAASGRTPTPAAPATAKTEKSHLTYYQVKGGDTLWTIARKYNLTPEKIRRWNNIEGDMIRPGLRLLIRVSEDMDV